MIGRNKRTRVVFIDGIPIESATLDAGTSGVQKEDPVANPLALKELEPRALFDKYDADGSGGIDVEEFKVLLKDLHIILSEPKALAYFKRCDKMHRGFISFEEFRLALYTCDPKNPNRTMGFAPGQALSPKDLFEMFDRDDEGAIDRATFIEILEFLGHRLPLDRMEGIFAAHEDPESEMMPYYQFKKAWLALVDVRAELRNRQEMFNRFLPQSVLIKKLEMLINEEEKLEARMLLEAAATLDEEKIAAYRRWLIDESITLSKLVLAEAIDAAGQVYMFGKGPFGRFDGEPIEPDFVDFMDYEVIQDLWAARIRPDSDALEDALKTLTQSKKSGDDHDGSEIGDTNSRESDGPHYRQAQNPIARPNTIPPGLTRAKMTCIAAARAFSGRQVSLVPTFLWGKRVRKVSVGPAVAYALTDSGGLFCWGGNRRKWRYFYDTTTLNEELSMIEGTDNTPTHSSTPGDRQLTTRTEILKQTLPGQAKQNLAVHDQFYLRQKYQRTFVKPVRPLPTDDEKRRKLHLLGQYFDLLPTECVDDTPNKSITNPTRDKRNNKEKSKKSKGEKAVDTPTISVSASNNEGEDETTGPPVSQSAPPPAAPTYQTLLETIEPDLNVDDLVVALELRGVHLAKQTRLDLIDKLGDCLQLELECMGPKFHNHMKEQDKAARRAKHDRQEKKLQNILINTTMLWNELRILLETIVRVVSDEFTKSEHEYLEMKTRITHAKQKIKRRAREGFRFDGSTDNVLHLNGLTSRGMPQQYFDGEQAILDIAVGSRHALAVHQTGRLFTWGVGSFGRLGGVRHDKSAPHVPQSDSDDDIDAWHRDIHSPQSVSALEHLRFRSVCCGFGHSLALTTDGNVYVWGSATHGKLGIGSTSSNAKESFTLTPLQLHLGRTASRVRKIACGPSHSALITTDGGLFVWGSGDGGKLGLGDERDVGEDRVPRNGGQLRVVETPVRVMSLSKENCVDVSCGTAHTIALTAITEDRADGRVSGGRVYAAGSNHALGKFMPTFAPLHIPRIDALMSTNDSDPEAKTSIVITRVSCGNAHTAVVSQDGELLTWGNNAGGCTGHPIVQPLIKLPTRVSCLYQYPRNLCLENGVRAFQSSQNASCLAEFALQKSGSPSLAESHIFSQTQQEMCPFWQVKLAAISQIERIVVVFKLPPQATSTSRTTQRSDANQRYTTSWPGSLSSRVSSSRSSRSISGLTGTKYVVLISEIPFDEEERGKHSVATAKGHSIYSSFVLKAEDDLEWRWIVPVDTYGRYVRVQVDNSVGMLSLESVSIVGIHAEEFNGSRVCDVACAEGVTVAICRPLNAMNMIRERFQRALRADRNSLWLLQQFETFHPFVREEINAKTHNGDDSTKQKCPLCRPKEKCVICLLDEATFAAEIQKDLARKRLEREEKHKEQLERERERQEEVSRQQKQLMRGAPIVPQNRNREAQRRKSMRDAKAKADAAAKASQGSVPQVEESEFELLKRTLTLEEKCQRLLRLNLLTEEEEAAAEKQLAAELLAIDPVAAQANKDNPQQGTLVQAANENSSTQLAVTKASSMSVLGRFASILKSRRLNWSVYAKPKTTP